MNEALIKINGETRLKYSAHIPVAFILRIKTYQLVMWQFADFRCVLQQESVFNFELF
jgi:hypothetical protein